MDHIWNRILDRDIWKTSKNPKKAEPEIVELDQEGSPGSDGEEEGFHINNFASEEEPPSIMGTTDGPQGSGYDEQCRALA